MKTVKLNNNRYYIKDNKSFISVTSLINTYYINKGLSYWKQITPLDKQESISKESLFIGNSFHTNIENYFNNREYNLDSYILDSLSKLETKLSIDKSNLVNTINTEVSFIYRNSNIGYAGTIDFKYSNFLIDWKTSKRKKYFNDILSYCLQLSAYCRAFNCDTSYLFINNYIKKEVNLFTLNKEQLDFFFNYFCMILYDYSNNTTNFNQKIFEIESKEHKISSELI